MQASGCGGGWGGTSQRKYVIVLISSRSFLQKGIGSLELLVWCFQKELNYLFGVSEKVLNYLFETPVVFHKNHVLFEVRIMSFHKNPKRCDLIWSLNGAKAFPFQLNVRYPP